MAKSSDSEGLIIAGGLVVIMVSLAGSLATGMGPVDFFFLGTGILAMTTFLGGGLLIGAFALYKALRETQANDERTLWQRLQQDYNIETLKQDIRTIFSHLKLMIAEKRPQDRQDD